MAALLSKKKKQSVVVMRLTDTERLFIILGMAVQSTVSFLPSNMDLPTVGLIYSCTVHSSLILVLTPVFVYLNRMTTSFTLLVLFGGMTTFLVSQLLFSFSFFFNPTPNTYGSLNYGGRVCALLAFAFVLLATLISFIKFIYKEFGTDNARESCCTWFHRLRTLGYQEWKQNIMDNPHIYATYIPALHIVACFVIIAAHLYVGYLPKTADVVNYNYKNFIVIFVETILLVTEFRFRKSELEKGLVSFVLSNI
jgi:hypothetical protein